MVIESWIGLFGPKGMPDAERDRISKAFSEAVNSEEGRKRSRILIDGFAVPRSTWLIIPTDTPADAARLFSERPFAFRTVRSVVPMGECWS